ncbi:uncharacterized, partial [Tachysurus ichikawai]
PPTCPIPPCSTHSPHHQWRGFHGNRSTGWPMDGADVTGPLHGAADGMLCSAWDAFIEGTRIDFTDEFYAA